MHLRYRALEDDAQPLLVVAACSLVFLTSCGGGDVGRTVTTPVLGASIDLSAFAEAWGGGDADRLREFYTDDALIFPIGVDEVGDGTMSDLVPWAMGPDIDREVGQHAGGVLEIFHAVRVGDIASYTWRWSFPTVTITGADILHFRGDLIWRQFIDYQVGG